jgi:HPt (histidine-containing phosphotransfer) domain-containing protein
LNAALNKFVRDRQPIEVVEAARKAQNDEALKTEPQLGAELARVFVKDVEKTLAILQSYEDNGSYDCCDLHMYVINVHALKSALANVGETALSDFARELEQAGRERDTAILSRKTSAFLYDLKAVIKKYKPDTLENGKNKSKSESTGDVSNVSDEDMAYLREMLKIVHSACGSYDAAAAKEALAKLKKKTWPGEYDELFDTIAEYLLNSEFDEVEAVCAPYLQA